MCHCCINYMLNVCLKHVILYILTLLYTDVIVITDPATFVSLDDPV